MSNTATINRLAVYGTLAPGRENQDQLAPLKGEWKRGMVRGKLMQTVWAAKMGYPALVLDPQAPPVDVQLFESPELAQNWQRLDEFEGPGYRRVLVDVQVDGGIVQAWIYEALAERCYEN